jgi:hypothetical protein
MNLLLWQDQIDLVDWMTARKRLELQTLCSMPINDKLLLSIQIQSAGEYPLFLSHLDDISIQH